jgi:diaminopimelate decarboxylase
LIKPKYKKNRCFKEDFQKEEINTNIFYATKSNYYPRILNPIVEEGNLNVSSQQKLKLSPPKAGTKFNITTS